MEKTIKGTGAKVGTIFSNVDRNMIEMVNVIVRLVYPDYRVVDYADPANPPGLLQENDCYLVGADGTVWGETVQKDQLLRWDGSAWQIEPYKFSDWYDPLGSKLNLPDAITNLMVVDTKGIILDANNRGRVLQGIDSDGWMYFKESYQYLKKIHIDDFLSGLVAHDGSGTDASRIDWLELPVTQTLEDKQAKLALELPNWKMCVATEFQNIITSGGRTYNSLLFGNDSIYNSLDLVRKNTTTKITPVLNSPVVGNPTHLLIKQGETVIQEIELVNGTTNGIKWGEMKADKGTITYASNVFAAINFNNGKEITINGLNIPAGTYDFVLRGRRTGTNCINGDVQFSTGETTLGTLSLVDTITITGGDEVAKLVDNSVSIVVSNTLTSVTMKVVCAETKDFRTGNGGQRPSWGNLAEGQYGMITEYDSITKRSGFVYFSQDFGETWDVVFDVSLNENFVNPGGIHIHGGFFDKSDKKIYWVGGDTDSVKGAFYADFSNGISLDTAIFTYIQGNQPFFGQANKEQFISGYALSSNLVFGTDCSPSSICYVKKQFPVQSRNQAVEISSNLSHIPGIFHKNGSSPLFIMAHRGGYDHPDRLKNTNIVYATYTGEIVKEIFKDKCKTSSFANNVYANVFFYNGKIFFTTFGDGRFDNGHTLFIGDYL